MRNNSYEVCRRL
uniref:Uncharacterized protein n=1 Tax=Anguilla anguilla TaxID=7936 RepID=A0A0E9VSY1_ANGAN